MTAHITQEQKADLLERIAQSRRELDDIVARLGEAQLAAPGPDGGWAVKDHLAHLAAWEQKLLAMLGGQPGYVGLQVDASTYQQADIDELNALLHERFKGLSSAEALVESRRSYEQLLAAIQELPAEQLGAPYAPDDPEESRRMIEGIVDNTYNHYDEHHAAIEQIIAFVQ